MADNDNIQYVPVYNQMSEGLLQYQLDAQDVILEVEGCITGKRRVYNKEEYKYEWKKNPYAPPLINDKGMAVLLTILQSRISKIFILSDLPEEQIISMTVSIGNNVIDTLYEHWDEYEVKSISAANTIKDLITDTVYSTLSKSKNRIYLDFLKTSQRIVEQSTVAQHSQTPYYPGNQPGKSAASKIPFVGKFFN